VRNGTVDVVVSAHNPQDVDTKRLPFADAEAGAIGLETLLGAALRLYHNESLSLMRLIEVLSTAPAKLYGLDAGTLKVGAKADFAVVDLYEPWVVKADELHSLSKNSSFEDAKFQGRTIRTVVNGKTVYAL
jgi:dihydroorotase